MPANSKSPDAFRTISEVSEWLDTPAHVLRFWESKFSQIKPVKRAGGRRYYRPADMQLLAGIKSLLHDEGMTIRGVQKILREEGPRYVAELAPEVDFDAALYGTETAEAEPAPAPPQTRPAAEDNVVKLAPRTTPSAAAPPEPPQAGAPGTGPDPDTPPEVPPPGPSPDRPDETPAETPPAEPDLPPRTPPPDENPPPDETPDHPPTPDEEAAQPAGTEMPPMAGAPAEAPVPAARAPARVDVGPDPADDDPAFAPRPRPALEGVPARQIAEAAARLRALRDRLAAASDGDTRGGD